MQLWGFPSCKKHLDHHHPAQSPGVQVLFDFPYQVLIRSVAWEDPAPDRDALPGHCKGNHHLGAFRMVVFAETLLRRPSPWSVSGSSDSISKYVVVVSRTMRSTVRFREWLPRRTPHTGALHSLPAESPWPGRAGGHPPPPDRECAPPGTPSVPWKACWLEPVLNGPPGRTEARGRAGGGGASGACAGPGRSSSASTAHTTARVHPAV